jgi:hypothetical protein
MNLKGTYLTAAAELHVSQVLTYATKYVHSVERPTRPVVIRRDASRQRAIRLNLAVQSCKKLYQVGGEMLHSRGSTIKSVGA